jgi:hypothetical protein
MNLSILLAEIIKDLLRPIVKFNLKKDYYIWRAKYSKDLEKFRNIHQDEDCFIIGNGPSLNNTDLNLLKDYHVIGLNKINLIFEKYELKLSYHICVNSEVIEQITDKIETNVFECPSFISYTRSKGKNFTNKNVFRLFSNDDSFFGRDITKPIREGYTVTFVAMQVAFFMGFKNIYLLGVDHNFQQKGSPNELQKLTTDDINHFHPDYFKGQNWHLADLDGSELSYSIAKYEYNINNRNIMDCTVNGKLKIFKKLDFAKAITIAKKKIKIDPIS